MAKKIQLSTQIEKYMSKFGLNPVDRAKLAMQLNPPEKDDEDNPFSGKL
jgi:phage terminase small subunit